MIESRWQLPESPLRASVGAAKAAGLVLVATSAVAIRASLHLTAGYPVAATMMFVLCMGLAIGFLNGSHPFSRFGPANQITMVRLTLVALVASLIVEAPTAAGATVAVGASLAATALDGVDGWLARRKQIASAFGARFDMEIDALLILALSALAFRVGKAGGWVLASGLLRYAFVAAAWPMPWLSAPLPESFRRKAICVLQVVSLIVVVAPGVNPPVSTAIAAAALAALAYSFFVDTLWLWRQAP